jgi:Fic family protein
LSTLLDEDSLSATTPISGLSERRARRLFDRLVELDVVRELTGRASFRLYGL